MNIEQTVKKINNLIDNTDKNFKTLEVMQLSQAVLSLAHAAEILHTIKINK